MSRLSVPAKQVDASFSSSTVNMAQAQALSPPPAAHHGPAPSLGQQFFTHVEVCTAPYCFPLQHTCQSQHCYCPSMLCVQHCSVNAYVLTAGKRMLIVTHDDHALLSMWIRASNLVVDTRNLAVVRQASCVDAGAPSYKGGSDVRPGAPPCCQAGTPLTGKPFELAC